MECRSRKGRQKPAWTQTRLEERKGLRIGPYGEPGLATHTTIYRRMGKVREAHPAQDAKAKGGLIDQGTMTQPPNHNTRGSPKTGIPDRYSIHCPSPPPAAGPRPGGSTRMSRMPFKR